MGEGFLRAPPRLIRSLSGRARARLRLLGAHGGRLAMGGAYAEYCWVMNEMSGLVSRGVSRVTVGNGTGPETWNHSLGKGFESESQGPY